MSWLILDVVGELFTAKGTVNFNRWLDARSRTQALVKARDLELKTSNDHDVNDWLTLEGDHVVQRVRKTYVTLPISRIPQQIHYADNIHRA